ncbi:MAG: addiction module protein [Gammaproteobacteria bacterium]
MARALADIERDIHALIAKERAQLLKALISELDAPADPDADRAWLEESQRRLAEIEAGIVKGSWRGGVEAGALAPEVMQFELHAEAREEFLPKCRGSVGDSLQSLNAVSV